MSKREAVSDVLLLARLREKAEDLESVKVSRSALDNMQRIGVTRRGVCAALCDYLDAGGTVDQTVTDSAEGHIGEIMYEMFPEICLYTRYVKVRIVSVTDSLYIVSVHD